MNLSSTIKSIQDIMRKDDGVDGDAQRIGQLSWMLFLKVFDQREEEWEDDAADRGEIYKSSLLEACRWRNWAKYIPGEDGKSKPQMQPSDLINYVNNTVFPGLKELNIEGPEDDPNTAKAKVVRAVFQDANNFMKSGTLMLGVIEKLDEAINFHDFQTRQHMGDIYEQILNDLRSAGNAGEFYTPRAITHFMVQMVNPRLKKRETVLDPACGTGGFLTATIEHFHSQINKKSGAKDQKAIETCIRGMEKKQLPHLLCTTNLLLNGIDVPSQIEHRNTLANPWNEWTKQEQVECVITNPPFGGMEDEGVGADYPADVRTRETAEMFLTLISRKVLKEGGRAAIVLPDGVLFGDGIKARIKEWLLEHCNLHTIVRLPNGVFSPYTGIKTNLLFFTKGKETETIWFYEHPYPEGYKSYSKTKPMRIEEFEAEKNWWGKEVNDFAERVENEYAWRIDFKTLKSEAKAKAQPFWSKAETLNNQASDLDFHIKELRNTIKGNKEIEAPEAESHDPDELLAKYKFAAAAIAALTGTKIKDKETMKAPKTELVTKLKLKTSPNNKDQAPLSAILAKHNGELSAKALYTYSGIEIDGFYQQLKSEMAEGWIEEPEKAQVIERASSPDSAEVA